ncbi:PGF-pre-PGF domain-containing protein [Natronosalvus amylolyticus]|uniref:PGF-pre-PGF domain-containing protein n=1 Tax=Natronosalvus amylolyticus TaxID=2961994 RepID=UPI0020C96967|nr:PGF-pre-PGF domain-containing protein [Natronosalvus amylolyticus]
MNATRAGVIVALILIVAIPTAAVTIVENSSQDQISDDIVAQPSEGSNGAYAFIDPETDELVIDLTANNTEIEGSGVSVEALSGIDDIFTLTYTGEDFAQVWLEHDSDHVTFYDTSGDSLEGQANNVTLEHNETVHVGFSVDTRESDLEAGDMLIDSIEINAQVPEEDDDDGPGFIPAPPSPPADPDPPEDPPEDPDPPGQPPIDLIVGPGERTAAIEDIPADVPVDVPFEALGIGEFVTLERLEVTFADDGDAEFTVLGEDALEGDGQPLADENTTSAIGEFEITETPDPDRVETVTYTLGVDRSYLESEGIDTDALVLYRQADDGSKWDPLTTTVVEETDDQVVLEATYDGFSRYALGVDQAVFTVEDVTAEPSIVTVRESTTLETTITNTGEEVGTFETEIVVEETVIDTVTVTLEPGESETVATEYTTTGTGSYEIIVDGQVEATILVEPPAEDPPSDDTVETDDLDELDEPTEEPGGFGVLEIGGILMLLVLLTMGLWGYRNREQLPSRGDFFAGRV